MLFETPYSLNFTILRIVMTFPLYLVWGFLWAFAFLYSRL